MNSPITPLEVNDPMNEFATKMIHAHDEDDGSIIEIEKLIQEKAMVSHRRILELRRTENHVNNDDFYINSVIKRALIYVDFKTQDVNRENIVKILERGELAPLYRHGKTNE